MMLSSYLADSFDVGEFRWWGSRLGDRVVNVLICAIQFVNFVEYDIIWLLDSFDFLLLV